MQIGSFFEFPKLKEVNKESSVLYNLKKKNFHMTFVGDGRQAIKLILLNFLETHYVNSIYLPAYACFSVIQPFLELSLKFNFYKLNSNLEPILNLKIKNSLIYLIDYFGKEILPNEIIENLSKNNLIILDITHSIFNEDRFKINSENVILVASLRKIFPIPDGGIIYSKIPLNTNELKRNTLYIQMLDAMILKKFYIEENLPKTSKKIYLKLYKNYEERKNKHIIRILNIPSISLDILINLDYFDILKKRKRNLYYLYKNLRKKNNFAFFYKKEEIKSPFIFPLIFRTHEEREYYRKKLIEKDIYTPVHWALPKFISNTFEEERKLSERILSIPIDQRYGKKEMKYIINAIESI